MQVAAVVQALAAVRRHEAGHPAAVGVAERLTLLRAVGEEIDSCGGESRREAAVRQKTRVQLQNTNFNMVISQHPTVSIHNIPASSNHTLQILLMSTHI